MMTVKNSVSIIIVLFAVVCFIGKVNAEIISFNSPLQWQTLRTDTIIAKVQLDTSKFPQKKINFTLSKVEAGKKKLVSTTTLSVSDFLQEVKLVNNGSFLVGGKNFLRLDWSIPGSKEVGCLFPIGIADLEKIDKVAPLQINTLKDSITEQNYKTILGSLNSISIKNNQFGLLWNAKQLLIVCKKNAEKTTFRFAFDAKNGKNAFLSYPDRVLNLNLGNDSVSTLLYERVSAVDTISYSSKSWKTDIKSINIKNEYVVIVLPWYDLGLIPFQGRVIGFSAFVILDKTASASFPEKADLFLPGSWGSAILK